MAKLSDEELAVFRQFATTMDQDLFDTIDALQRELTEAKALCPECGYSAWRISAETGKVIFCEVCNARQERRDFRTERDEARAQLAPGPCGRAIGCAIGKRFKV